MGVFAVINTRRHPLVLGDRTLGQKNLGKVDTLGIEPRAFRMRSGCDTTAPCAPCSIAQRGRILYNWSGKPAFAKQK